jgi:hypothetical protein
MAAPTGDKVIPPIIFLVMFMGTFILIVQAMAPTISSNQENSWNPPDTRQDPDYMLMFDSATYSWWEPNPFLVDGSGLINTYPMLGINSELVSFSNAAEAGHNIKMWGISMHVGWVNSYHELFFDQKGGWFGLQKWEALLRYPEDLDPLYMNDTGVPSPLVGYKGTINLRHDYTVILSGYNESSLTLDEQIDAWTFNVSIVHLIDANRTANPWAIVGQLFSLSLPGIPLWLNALLLAPIIMIVALVAFVIIRGAIPG